ncbi:MAG: FliH/SctL family protein [Acidobacteria bacterium]|nr:FliH/SctL family protein [Acidobacteriota bacterium]
MSSRIVPKASPDESTPMSWTLWNGCKAPSQQTALSGGSGGEAARSQADAEAVARLQNQLAALHAETVRREEQARQLGAREGEQAGARAAAAELQPVIARLGRTIEELGSLRRRFRSEAEKDIIKLTLAIAKRVLHREINMDPEAMLGLIRVALEQIDLRELHRVRLHPVDAPAVERHIAAAGIPDRVQVVADPTLERGGAIFETTHGNLDASISTQLEEITRGFGDLLERAR